eukprot:CAMPEP_0170512706 /NCGR_PEP_ID=MMETSP0208-20121228/66998_1 /TAXON_ID=197538 /ORGANISM="Strombidium inclinatum, Strain S3" /LENGTH=95 /DNA_ID=CAMNT_0010796367 /DNA_START=127 /DNA_END=414 /DNA_ORIENTATION=-
MDLPWYKYDIPRTLFLVTSSGSTFGRSSSSSSLASSSESVRRGILVETLFLSLFLGEVTTMEDFPDLPETIEVNFARAGLLPDPLEKPETFEILD